MVKLIVKKSYLGEKKNKLKNVDGIFVQEYEEGWLIKPYKQNEIIISKSCGAYLALSIRDKSKLRTLNEAENELMRASLN